MVLPWLLAADGCKRSALEIARDPQALSTAVRESLRGVKKETACPQVAKVGRRQGNRSSLLLGPGPPHPARHLGAVRQEMVGPQARVVQAFGSHF